MKSTNLSKFNCNSDITNAKYETAFLADVQGFDMKVSKNHRVL